MLFFGTAERASRSLPGTSTCKVADAGHGEWDFFEPNRAVQLSPCTVAKKKRKKEEEKKEEKKEKKTPILGLASRSMSIKESMAPAAGPAAASKRAQTYFLLFQVWPPSASVRAINKIEPGRKAVISPCVCRKRSAGPVHRKTDECDEELRTPRHRRRRQHAGSAWTWCRWPRLGTGWALQGRMETAVLPKGK